MGLFLSKCGICRHSVPKCELNDKISILQQQLCERAKNNNELINTIEQLNYENDNLKAKSNHAKNILSNSSDIADAILLSELKCQWMDDAKEKEYLISIIDYLNTVCSDTTIRLYTNPDGDICTHSLLKNKSD